MSNEVDKTELLPCPFCPDGGKPYFTKTVNGTNMAYVGCGQCGVKLKAQVQFLTSREDWRLSKDIVGIWNTRVSKSADIRGLDQPWPLRDVLLKLLGGMAHLRDVHNCDCHGYEEDIAASEAAQRYADALVEHPVAIARGSKSADIRTQQVAERCMDYLGSVNWGIHTHTEAVREVAAIIGCEFAGSDIREDKLSETDPNHQG